MEVVVAMRSRITFGDDAVNLVANVHQDRSEELIGSPPASWLAFLRGPP
jgi:hypothetical protein